MKSVELTRRSLLEAAARGLFLSHPGGGVPTAAFAVAAAPTSVPGGSGDRTHAAQLEPRCFRVRRAEPSDAPALERLERLCWPAELRASNEELAARLSRHPDGQYVAELEGQVVAVIYSQRIAASERLHEATADTVGRWHVADGKLVQLLAVNADPAHQELGLGACLLELMLELAPLETGVEAVVAVTLCSGHARYPEVPAQDYLTLRGEDGQLLDPTLHFHEQHGASIVGIVEGYRPRDRVNEGRGVLVRYDLSARQAADAPRRANAVPVEQRAAHVEAAIREVSRGRGREVFALDVALRDQGLDSLALIRLRAVLEARLSLALSPTLFFTCSTPRSLIRFLEEGPEHAPSEQVEAPELGSVTTAEELLTKARSRPGSAAASEGVGRTVTEGAAGAPGRAAPHEPIAIIGMTCRFPGAEDLEAYWRVLRDGVDAVHGAPVERPGAEAGKAPPGGLLPGIDAFDAELFGVSPREAPYIDPQQRLLLEAAWSAFEHAGLSRRALMGSATGVFVGAFAHDYEQVQRAAPRSAEADHYFATGSAPSLLAGRIAYALGLRGPALVVDTACSSSLVAVHQACQSLRSRECDVALAAGVNLILDGRWTESFARAGMLAADARCKVFDARADGYVRSEGCAALVLTPLSRALERGDVVFGVILGSAINQDGASNGLTAPSGAAQQAVIRAALAAAGVTPREVGYVEAHGTGTPLGDPVEVEALAQVFGGERDGLLYVGSAKANIGHAEAAAGLAGLLKLVLSLAHGLIPAQIHLLSENPLLQLGRGPLSLPRQASPWPEHARLGGVSSFGFSGTNAHVIVGPSPRRAVASSPEAEERAHVLPLSARSEGALRGLLERYRCHLDQLEAGSLAELSYSAATGRSHERYRVALAGSSVSAIRRALDAGPEPVQARSKPQLAALFTGQGAQWPGMGAELYRREPCFARVLDRCEELSRGELELPLLDVMFGDATERLSETAYTQPALFALSMALQALYASFGVTPAAALGHSVGEYAAACVAGVFSLEDGLRLVTARGRILSAAPGEGAMAVIFAPEARVARAIAPFLEEVSLAAVNGRENVVISGERRRVELIVRQLESEGLATSRLHVSHAFHSPQMDAVLEPFARVAETVTFHAPRLPLVSNLSGEVVSSDEVTRPDYWVRHVRQPVRFREGLAALRRLGHDVFLELGPKPVLLGMARADADPDAHWIASLRQVASKERSSPEAAPMEDIAASLAQLYGLGFDIDWPRVFSATAPRRVALPVTPFERRRYWLSPASPSVAGSAESGSWHPLLAERVQSAALPAATWVFPCLSLPAAAAHRLSGEPVLSAAYSLELARAAGARALGSDAVAVTEVSFVGPAPVSGRLEVIVEAGGAFRICSLQSAAGGESWREHVQGRVVSSRRRSDAAEAANGVSSEQGSALAEVEATRARLGRGLSVATFHAALAERGIDYGDLGQALVELWSGPGEALARLALSAAGVVGAEYPCLHPSWLDAGLQVAQAALPRVRDGFWIPAAVERVELVRPTRGEVWCRARVRSPDVSGAEVSGALRVDLSWTDPEGSLATLSGLTLVRSRRKEAPAGVGAAGAAAPTRSELTYEVRWRPELGFGGDLEFLPRVTALAAALDSHKSEAPVALTRSLEAASLRWIARAFAELGRPLSLGRALDRETLAAELGIVPEHHALLERLLGILEAAGHLRPTATGHEVSRVVESSEAGAALLEEASGSSLEARLLGRSGRALAAVLRGLADPLEVIFPEADVSTAAELYRESAAFAPMNALLARAVQACAERIPAGRGLSILEIGGGTGGTTAHLLPELARRVQQGVQRGASGPVGLRYVFTDVSASFTRRARQRFAEYGFVEYQTLDVEADTAAQGFEPEAYDLVIAANVLHATADVRAALARARGLLRPGGLLLLLEGTERRAWVDLIFGLLSGWWKFADTELRPDHPLLPESQWLRLLGESGFAEAAAQTAWHSAEQAAFPQALFLARAGSKAKLVALRAAAPSESGRQGPARQRVLCFWPDELPTGVRESALDPARALGVELIQVSPGARYARLDACRYVLDASSQHDYRRLLGEVGRLDAVVHGWSAQPAQPEAAAQAFELGCGSLLCLVQALVERVEAGAAAPAHERNPSLWVVTLGAQGVLGTDGVPGLVHSTVWGLSRSVRAEHPELRCRLVDLDPEAPAEGWGQLLAALTTEREGEAQTWALREGLRWVPELHPLRSAALGSELRLRGDGTYLVVGGLGGMGRRLARWLVQRGARHLVLTGRNAAGASADELRRSLESAGARVELLGLDVAEPRQVRELLHGLRERGRCLRGVVHAAGIYEDRLLVAHDAGSLARVFAPKVSGAWNLHRGLGELAHGQPEGEGLDFFVLCGSAMSVSWCAGLGNYAAANAFLDALAQHRRALGLPCLSVGWGPWEGVGMAARVSAGRRAQWLAQGLRPIEPARCLEALERLLGGSVASPLVVDADWERVWAGADEETRAWLAPCVRRAAGHSELASDDATLEKLQAALAAPEGLRQAALLAYLEALLVDVLGRQPGRVLDPDAGFFALGLDSLTATELRHRLERQLQISIEASAPFKYPNLSRLSRHLMDRLYTSKETPPRAAPVAGRPEPEEAPAHSTLRPGPSRAAAGALETELAELEALLGGR